MNDDRVVRFLDLAHGDIPCSRSRGNWRLVAGDLCVCRACYDPATTCYAKLGNYGELPPSNTRALVPP